LAEWSLDVLVHGAESVREMRGGWWLDGVLPVVVKSGSSGVGCNRAIFFFFFIRNKDKLKEKEIHRTIRSYNGVSLLL
jgi:hypothetical protein